LKKPKLYCLLSFLLLTCTIVHAQLTVQFVPMVSGQSLQGLSLVQMNSSSSSIIKVALKITIREVNTADVVTVQTPGFYLRQGVNTIDRAAFANSRFSFWPNFYGTTLKQTGKLPEGEYEYCFETEVLETKDASILPNYQQCFSYRVQPLTPLLLIQPVDEDILCNKRPGLTWQPPMPLPTEAKFRVILAEIKEKQDPIEAINFNVPVINQAEIRVNTLNYPVNIPELKEASKYAWQVTIYINGAILKKSEIWTFTVKCKDEKKPENTESYRELKEVYDGKVYYAYEKLRFFFNNPYNEGMLNYRIYSLFGKQEEIKKLPALKMATGYNQFEIDLSEVKGLKGDENYLLKVWLADNKVLQLRFVYKEL